MSSFEESERRLRCLIQEKMDMVHRGGGGTAQYTEQELKAKKRDSQMMTCVFSAIALSIFSIIAFSIWLSIEMGVNRTAMWNAGKFDYCICCEV